jgi:hypothetical protein
MVAETSGLIELHCDILYNYTVWNKYLINKHKRD